MPTAAVSQSTINNPQSTIENMDYLTLALILFAIGVIMLVAEILLPTGGILVVVSLLFFSLGVGII
ncbi:MAG TPA: hypothetical protein VKE74_06630, partial [Gemmataceae bacterium]|nr:hypothetical protein [Gemmataceae bacterium]